MLVRPLLALLILTTASHALAAPDDGVWVDWDRSTRRETIRFGGIGGDVIRFFNNELGQVCGGTGDESVLRSCRDVRRRDIADDGTRTAYDYQERKLAEYRIVGGRLDGPFITYAVDGSVHIEGTFRGGMREGSWKERRGDRVKLEASFVNNALDGTVTHVYDTTQVTAQFRRGVRHGVYERSSAGRTDTITFVNGKATGPSRDEWHNGAWTGSLLDGKRHGPWIFTDTSGDVTQRETYRDGLREGPATYLEDGEVRALSYRGDKLHGWGTFDKNGVVTRRRWEDGALVEVWPRPPSYRWRSLGADVTAGPMLGSTDSIQTHITLTNVWGTAERSRDGQSVGGGYVALGGDLSTEYLLDNMTSSAFHLGAGPTLELGWAFGRRDDSSENRSSRVFAQVTPSINTAGDVRGRIGVGISSPAHGRRMLRAAVRASENALPTNCGSKHGDDESDCIKFVTMLLVPVMWVTAPIWTINHVELTAEAGGDYRTRYGVMLGWGF